MTTLFISHSSKDKAWAEEIHAALVERKYPEPFLDSHPDDGIPVGDKWEQTLWQRLRRSGGMIVLCTPDWLASPWCVAETMIARERGKRVFLLAASELSDGRQGKSGGNGAQPPRMPDFLKDTQMISLATMSRKEAHQQLWDRLDSLKRERFRLPARPYPGLEPFQETDAAVYFGRDREIDQVIAVLNQRRHNNAHGFILILGASGCGKSSLVRAGVLPRLRRAGGDDGARAAWVIVPPFTGGKGLRGLALSFAQAFKDAGQPRDLAAVLRQLGAASDVRTLATELLLAHGAPEGSVLLVLDQLEEVFGTSEGSEPALPALRLLLDASADAGSPLAVLATMRSDFLDAFQLFEGDAESYEAESYEKVTLGPMPRSRFSEVIEGPADRFGLYFDPGLAVRMADETAYHDALPLLAFTLEKLYERCKAENRLTRKAYDELGGVDAAIKQAADRILEETGYIKNGKALPDDDPRMRDLRRAFFSLAKVGEEGQFTRQPASSSQMPVSCEAILKRFVDQRLLVSDTANGGKVLSVAHEALFRVWDTLKSWLQADRKALDLRRQIEDAAAEWQAKNRAASRAWAEERVLDEVRVIEDSGVSLDDVTDRATVKAFLGPTDPEEIAALPALDAAQDAVAGSGRYGDAWQLPLSHQARASVGDRLALLGDCRKGVGLGADDLPDIDWVAIDGGEVTIEIRAKPDDPNSEVVKCLSRRVAPFRMARYPVTVTQFRAFLDKCHRDGKWLLPGVPKDLSPSCPPKPWARYGNQPVDNVNCFEASAFCQWLGAQLGCKVRLPTEFEWQQAATGGDPEQIYPWGAEWNPELEPWRANTVESNLCHCTAVGMYPAGASPAGVLDMAGTVWEWCLNLFEQPDETEFSTSNAPRVLRGGSWNFTLDRARAAFRLRYDPDKRNHTKGFRVVCSSRSSEP